MTSQAFSAAETAAVYRAIAERRDVRHGFLARPLPEDVVVRLLTAAHQAPSVGLMQPTRFVLVRDAKVRQQVYDAFAEANASALATYDDSRQAQYAGLKLEGLREAPLHLCFLCEPDSAQGHRLGRHTMPETALYSTVCAVQNFWLAARAEGIGVGWVSILDPRLLCSILKVPEHVTPVAYLCVGYTDSFASVPDLERFGWESRVSLESVVSYDCFGENEARPGE